MIYRTIVVCKDDIADYKKLLEERDFSVYVVNTIATINYDALDYRVILINHNIFEEFLNYIISNNVSNFYTYITFTYDNYIIKEAVSKKYFDNYEIINNII